jgi:hypothetical protein
MMSAFETLKYSVGEFAIPYLVNADASGISEEDQCLIDEWFSAATEDWYDADYNRWTYSHLSVDMESGEEFAYDEVSGYFGKIYTVTMLFSRVNPVGLGGKK